MKTIIDIIIRNRDMVIISVVLLTLVLGYQLIRVKMNAGFAALTVWYFVIVSSRWDVFPRICRRLEHIQYLDS